MENLSPSFAKTVLGTISYGERDYPLQKITFNSESGGARLLFICGVHGNEPAPVYAMEDFILNLSSHPELGGKVPIDFYILNPWGFEHNSRYSGTLLDFNRDWEVGASQEAALLLKFIDADDYDGVFDFHEASSTGTFLYCYGLRNRPLSRGIRVNKVIMNYLLEWGEGDG